jgi:transposase
VYDRERRMLLRHYLEQGWTKTALAEHFGMNRRTVERWVAGGQLGRDLDAEPVRYGPRRPAPTKLDPYKPLVEARLAQYPELSAVRLFAEVEAAGYAGSLTQLKGFVRQVRPRPEPEPVIRFETAPGHQAQVDFAEFKLPWGKRYALLVVLGYSRLLWLRFVLRQDMATLIRGLEEAFGYVGGVPRELLFDQMRAVITRDDRLQGGRLVRNAEFLRFAAHWGFVARACRPYRAQTKGKVERPIRYVRASLVYGREFLGDGQLAEETSRWLETVANARVHGTTKEAPRERFERDERAALQPLASRPYHSLVLSSVSAEPRSRRDDTSIVPLPRVDVEQRPLRMYAALAALAAGGGGE